MRKSVLLVLLVAAFMLLAAVPGVAGQGAVEKDYYAVECFDEPIFTAPPKIVGNTIHVRDAIGHADEWLWDEYAGEEGAWIPVGENNTVINFNGKFGPMGPYDLHLWGTFAIDLGELGTFAGSWATGHAVGKAADGTQLRADFDPVSDIFDSFPGCEEGQMPDSAVYTIKELPN